jgi:putative PIN family toxin of toxin-antitoxin system
MFMRIVVDTNVVISGTFFKGNPRRVLEAIIKSEVEAYATTDIVEEYQGVVRRIIERGVGTFDGSGFIRFIADLNLIESLAEVSVCRDPDDNKFISCAIDADALYIVSGDKDLLDLKEYEGIQMITAADFVEKYLK